MILLVESVWILPSLRVAATAHRGDCRPAGQIDAEFFLERLAKLIALEFVEQRLEGRTEADLIDRKAARRRNLRIIGIDRCEPAGLTNPDTIRCSNGSLTSGVARNASSLRYSRHFCALLSTAGQISTVLRRGKLSGASSAAAISPSPHAPRRRRDDTAIERRANFRRRAQWRRNFPAARSGRRRSTPEPRRAGADRRDRSRARARQAVDQDTRLRALLWSNARHCRRPTSNR